MGLQPLFMSLILSVTYLFMDVMLLWSLFSGKWSSWLKFISSFWLCFGSTQLALLNVECFLVENMDTGICGSEPSFDHSFMISSLIGMVDCSWIDILWFFFMASWFITLFNCDMIYVHVTLKPSLVFSPIFLWNFRVMDSDAITECSLFFKVFDLGLLPLMKIEQFQTWHWRIKTRTRR